MLFQRHWQGVLHPPWAPLPRAHRHPVAGDGGGSRVQRHGPGVGDLPAPVAPQRAFDNGTEFARHYRLHDLGVQTFFCDIHSPCQKGGVENATGRMRRVLTRKIDLADISSERFDQLVLNCNNPPRKCLGHYTPAEVFPNHLENNVLHLNCESTFPSARE